MSKRMNAVFVVLIGIIGGLLVYTAHSGTVHGGRFWMKDATQPHNSAFVVAKRATNQEQAHDWAVRENADNKADPSRNGHTYGTASANILDNDPDFKSWAKDQYRDWVDRQTAVGKASSKRCCNFPDPADWYNGFVDHMRNGACHITTGDLAQVKCAATIVDDIVLHPAKIVFSDAYDCAGGVGVGAALTASATIKWNKLLGYVGGLPVYAPRWTWLLNNPTKIATATAICMGTNYILRIIRGN